MSGAHVQARAVEPENFEGDVDLLTVEIDRDLRRIQRVAVIQLGFDDDVLRRQADQVRQRSLAVHVVVIEADVTLE